MGVAIDNCQILDVSTGKVTADGVIVIIGKKIAAVGHRHEVEVPTDSKIIDVRRGWVLPGLMDLHVHMCEEPNPELAPSSSYHESATIAALRAARNIQTALQAGITLLRDVGSYKARNLEIRRAIEEGIFVGPRIVACGQLITSIKGHAYELGREVKTPEEIRKAVREEIEAGADFIKVTNDPIGFSVDQLTLLVEETHRFGKKVACHAFTEKAISMALQAGVDTIEHAVPFTDEMAQEMLMQDIVIVPTYTCAIETCKDTKKSLVTKEDLERYYVPWLEAETQFLPHAIKAGVKIAMGTDAGYPPVGFDSVHQEMQLLVQMGASPLQALQSATKVAAEAIGLQDVLGTLEPGKLADLIVVADNPLENIEVTHQVQMVVKDGQVVKYLLRS